ncbi:MAG: hypothetical protein ABII90_13085 [Bacteroidota bacterium]
MFIGLLINPNNTYSDNGASTKWIGGDPGGVSDWTIGANWSTGVPTAAHKAMIDPSATAYTAGTNDPILATTEKVNELIIENGGILNIQAGGDLTVDNKDFVVDGAGSQVNMSGGTVTHTSDGKGIKVKESAVFNFSGGNINTYGYVKIEEGATFNMSGASTLTIDLDDNDSDGLIIKGKNGLDALFDMDGGTVTINSASDGIELDGNSEGTTLASFNISGGTFTNDGPTSFKKGEGDNTLIDISGGTVTLSGLTIQYVISVSMMAQAGQSNRMMETARPVQETQPAYPDFPVLPWEVKVRYLLN